MNNPPPKEKAKQLINKYNLVVLDTSLGGSNQRVKKCALIAIEFGIELMEDAMLYKESKRQELYEIKQELQKL